MIVAESFLRSLITIYGKHSVYSDRGTWYTEAACSSLGLKHILHSSFEKSVIEERTLEYFKDRTENFDDYYPCRHKEYDLTHVHNWMSLFVFMYNADIRDIRFMTLVQLIGGERS